MTGTSEGTPVCPGTDFIVVTVGAIVVTKATPDEFWDAEVVLVEVAEV